ncbi:MAG: hypothetical protein AB7V13_06200 [Pseudorhodoplanes sp.]
MCSPATRCIRTRTAISFWSAAPTTCCGSGIWVSPAEVESVIAQHDAVLECAVVGHPDADEMIKPKAHVVPRE